MKRDEQRALLVAWMTYLNEGPPSLGMECHIDRFLATLPEEPMPECRTCDFCEPRKLRCRRVEELRYVVEYVDSDSGGAPDWCPLLNGQ